MCSGVGTNGRLGHGNKRPQAEPTMVKMNYKLIFEDNEFTKNEN
jgi:hypothetical protein